jgi:hypothetical protein
MDRKLLIVRWNSRSQLPARRGCRKRPPNLSTRSAHLMRTCVTDAISRSSHPPAHAAIAARKRGMRHKGRGIEPLVSRRIASGPPPFFATSIWLSVRGIFETWRRAALDTLARFFLQGQVSRKASLTSPPPPGVVSNSLNARRVFRARCHLASFAYPPEPRQNVHATKAALRLLRGIYSHSRIKSIASDCTRGPSSRRHCFVRVSQGIRTRVPVPPTAPHRLDRLQEL